MMPTKEIKICGCVVLYLPESRVFQLVKLYYPDVDRLYVIDNTEKERVNHDLRRMMQKLEKVHYISNLGNLGVAHALNQAVSNAHEAGYDFILTMDQDSCVEQGHVGKLLAAVQKNNIDLESVGIASPFHKNHPNIVNTEVTEISDKMVVMTSGNLLNVAAWKQVGGFWEDLFIDRVDHEYCLRLKLHKYRIIQINSVVMEHSLGNTSKHTLFGRTMYASNHLARRRYYITRNTLHVTRKYRKIFPEYVRFERATWFADFKSIILFEKEKLSKLRMMIKGYFDYKKGVFGKFDI
jgi:rhamnosyltransferase